MPTYKGVSLLLDGGANADCKPIHLLQFAVMGSAYMQKVFDIPAPSVGVLSIGEEETKGNFLVKHTIPHMREIGVNFKGTVEGRDVNTGDTDVIVCDGFSGNVILKNSEAVGKFAGAFAEETIRRCAAEKGEAPDEDLIAELRRSFYRQFDFNSQGGAFFFGTVKPVVKMHGAANASTAFSCIKQAIALDDKKFTDRLTTALDGKLPKRKFIRQQ